jgi:hypothetical protein
MIILLNKSLDASNIPHSFKAFSFSIDKLSITLIESLGNNFTILFNSLKDIIDKDCPLKLV